MTINLEKDLYPGNTLELWEIRKGKYVYTSDVELLEKSECRGDVTFLHRQSLYAYQCWVVKYPDGFTTKRKVYFRVSDGGTVPEEFIRRYTYNLYPYGDLGEEE